MRSHRGARLAIAAATLAAAMSAPSAVAGAEYTMVTGARYVVDDAAAKVVVTVDIAFTNTFAAPAGQVSVFNTIRLAIHDRAAAVAAGDGSGALNVSVAASGGVNVATITPRAPVQYGKTATLQLAYELRDGEDPAIRVGQHLVSFPAWGFGTRSEVRVELPSDYEVRVDGDELDAAVEGDTTILTSGTIADPTHWLANIGATREPAYETLQRAIPLAGGTADLQVRHWVDDPEWGTAMLDLVADALPRLEAAFGVSYPARGPLVITETVTAGGPDIQSDKGEVAVGFTEPPFTVLHQVAHVWAGEGLTGDRWLLEGLASWAAATVSTELELSLPHDPAAVASSLAANAFPLAEWDAAERSAAAEGWAQAASWSLTNQAAATAGAEAIREALGRMAAGLDGYDPSAATTPAGEVAVEPVPVTTRAYLDHLDAVTAEPIVEALAGSLLGTAAPAELTARTSARAAYDGLLQAAGDWGDPAPVRAAMVEWRFADAEGLIADAGAWLVGRDALLAEIEAAELTAPDRLAAAYQNHGGGEEAWAEIDAERAVVAAYADAAGSIDERLDPAARIGLLMGPGPDERLATAATAFAAGDLRVAADELAGLNKDLATATAGGLVRVLGVLIALAVAVLLTSMAMRRRRMRTDYTPEP
ncbi:MAG: hypothetical protein EHM90_02250 [Chloroflexi bacterium]|nr:MAG: hypothetical protein EHM90_02250 [Chloroflexota bacterium]